MWIDPKETAEDLFYKDLWFLIVFGVVVVFSYSIIRIIIDYFRQEDEDA